ncbi:MAG: putative sugar nucleotidyl transferase [Chitinophagaceae bacterium]
MMEIVLFDPPDRKALFPIVALKALADVKIGILTMAERWEKIFNQPVYTQTATYLQPLYASIPEKKAVYLYINAALMPNNEIISQIKKLQIGEALFLNNQLIAFLHSAVISYNDINNNYSIYIKQSKQASKGKVISFTSQLFEWNQEMIEYDFALITTDRTSQPLSLTNTLIGNGKVFIEPEATVEGTFINVSQGPVYIGKKATVMEGSAIRGPFSMNTNSVLKMGTKAYAGTSLGSNCIGGGEIKNVNFQNNSNKAHEGYLGDSVIGEWCNLGAGSSNSNVKNTGGMVKLYNCATDEYQEVAQKCGLILGDFSRLAINSSINTGTVIGVCCNVFGIGLSPKYLPNFSWGFDGLKYNLEKAFIDINNWMNMKNSYLSPQQKSILTYLHSNQS